MTNQVIIRASSVDKAVKKALEQLSTIKSEVDIKVIEEGRKGIFGIGSRQAIVKVTKKVERILDLIEGKEKFVQIENTFLKINKDNNMEGQEIIQFINKEKSHEKQIIGNVENYIKDIIDNIGITDTILSLTIENKKLLINMKSKKIALLIGKRGCIINSIQLLTQIYVNRIYSKNLKVIIDADGYREKRIKTLEKLALRTAERALFLKKDIALEPMSAYDRKIIHKTLSSKKDKIVTFSLGKNDYRYVVIGPRK